METKNNRIKRLLEQLQSSNDLLIIGAIDEIRAEADYTFIPVLAEVLHQTRNSEIEYAIAQLFNDLKDPLSVAAIMDVIKNERYLKHKETLIASCWQSGLDYSDYFVDFVDIVLKNDFAIALEAFTVIENFVTSPISTERETQIARLQNEIPQQPANKQSLIRELIHCLQN